MTGWNRNLAALAPCVALPGWECRIYRTRDSKWLYLEWNYRTSVQRVQMNIQPIMLVVLRQMLRVCLPLNKSPLAVTLEEMPSGFSKKKKRTAADREIHKMVKLLYIQHQWSYSGLNYRTKTLEHNLSAYTVSWRLDCVFASVHPWQQYLRAWTLLDVCAILCVKEKLHFLS